MVQDGLNQRPALTSPPATVLVVDDRATNREFVRMTLDDHGYRVLTARSGLEALAVLESEPADCVLLDVRMPERDGFEVFERLKALPGRADVPVLFLTAQRDVEAFDRAVRIGAADFLTKPIKPAELLLRVATALQTRRLGVERDGLHALLRKQRDDLARVMLQKERLAAFLVHDLKNPVSGMKLAANVLLADPDASDRTRVVAERIRQESVKLLRMIVDLLDIAVADEGRLVLTRVEVDLEDLTREVLVTLQLRAETRDLRVGSGVGCRAVHADRELLRRVLENLVENAIRHAPCGTEVSVTWADHQGGALLRVRDGGDGVPDDYRESIFDRYTRTHQGAPRTGQGLGLPFCKLVADAHGGRIWVEDGHPGTVFCVWFPGPPQATPLGADRVGPALH